MDISSGLIAKTLGALAAATAVSGGTWLVINGGDEVRSHRITRYDRALMDYLEDGGKIQFAVVDGSGNDLNEFPKDFNGKASKKIAIKIKINGDDNNVNTEGKLEEENPTKEGSKGTKSYLKSINEDNSDWTWTCEMTFAKEGGAGDPKEVDASQSDLVLKTDNEGLLGKLKKDISETEDRETKKLKKDFIRNCGRARGKEKNKEINEASSNSEIKNDEKKEMKFMLIVGKEGGEWGTDATKLFFKNKKKFEEWFSLKNKKPDQAVSV